MATYIDFQTAKLIKELGFNWPTYSYFQSRGGEPDLYRDMISDDQNSFGDCYARPAYSMVQKWLRDVHGIAVNIMAQPDGTYVYALVALPHASNATKGADLNLWADEFDNYEDALAAGVEDALNVIIE